MPKKPKTAVQLLMMASAVMAALWWVPSALAADDIAHSELSLRGGRNVQTNQGLRSYLGEWVLNIDIPDNPQHLLLKFTDVDGYLAATVQTAAQAQPQVVTNITMASLAVRLQYDASFGESESTVILTVRLLDKATMSGSISDELGMLVPEPEVADEHKTLGLGLYEFRVSGSKGGKLPGRALMDFAGNEVKISYVEMKTGTADYNLVAKVADGQVFEPTRARATKLFTDADLQFGDVVIETENAGENYPGVYSLWLKRVGDDWHLVFNQHADVWGTMYESEVDIAEIPLEHTTLDKKQTRFTIDIEQQQDGGLIKMVWGTHQWTAPFTIAQYPRTLGSST